MRWLSIQNLVSRFGRSRSTSKLFVHMHRQILPLLRSHSLSKLMIVQTGCRNFRRFTHGCVCQLTMTFHAFCMAFHVVTLRWQTCHSYSSFVLLGHVACIQNKLDRPVAWDPQSQSVSSMFTTSELSWVFRPTFFLCRRRLLTRRVVFLATRLLPFVLCHSSPSNEGPHKLLSDGTIVSSILHQCFDRRVRGNLIKTVGHCVSGSSSNLAASLILT